MEQYGGEADDTAAAGQRDFVTLAQPRPGAARRQNEYVDTPLRPAPGPKRSPSPPPVSKRLPVTSQPVKKKAPPPPESPGEPAAAAAAFHEDSTIVCRQCGRCKCEACRGPRPLPSRWVCDDKCLCSAPRALDYCTCMCCVRGLFYHWAKDHETDTDLSCADQPCSCDPHQRLLRWGCLALLALPLPCLCCYWPLRGGLGACERCYAKCVGGRGCRCPRRTQPPAAKRLLQPDQR